MLDRIPAAQPHFAVITPRKVAWAEPSTTLWQMRGGGNPLPDDDHLGGIAFRVRNHYGQTSQTGGPWIVSDSTPERKEMDSPEFEKWPNVTGCKNWKTSIRREVITGLTYPRQATDWLAQIDQAQAMHDLDDVGSVFGSTRMSFDPGLPNCGRTHEDHESCIQRENFRYPETFKNRQIPPLFTGRRIAFMIYAFFQNNDVQVRATSMRDSLDVELFNWRGHQKEICWKALDRRQVEPSTLMQMTWRFFIPNKVTAKSRRVTRG